MYNNITDVPGIVLSTGTKPMDVSALGILAAAVRDAVRAAHDG